MGSPFGGRACGGRLCGAKRDYGAKDGEDFEVRFGAHAKAQWREESKRDFHANDWSQVGREGSEGSEGNEHRGDQGGRADSAS
jgi:hypothetical protein